MFFCHFWHFLPFLTFCHWGFFGPEIHLPAPAQVKPHQEIRVFFGFFRFFAIFAIFGIFCCPVFFPLKSEAFRGRVRTGFAWFCRVGRGFGAVFSFCPLSPRCCLTYQGAKNDRFLVIFDHFSLQKPKNHHLGLFNSAR